VINTPSVRTTGASRHDFVVDEVIISEIQSDLLLDFNFFRFFAGIYALFIVGE